MSSPELNRQLEPEQAAAAHELGRHISVTAGPGSGKTTVLVERYLHILRSQKLSIDQIVAITFTNRAANEMRERLRSRLNQILQTASGEERKRWLNYKRTLDGAVITTIHGFCARLLREFPVEAGVDPQFILLDEHRAQMLLEATVEQVLTEFLSSNHAEISRLTLGVGRGRLADGLRHIYREVRGQGLSFADLKSKTEQSHATELHYQQALNELSQSMNDFLSVRRTTPATRTNYAELSSSWPGLQKMIGAPPGPENLADYCRAVEGFRKLRPQARGEFKEHIQALDALVWEKDLLGRVPQTCLDLFAKRYALELINLIARIDQRLNLEKQQLSALDFDDLELRTLELLARPEVIARTSERYKFFLVDEFQDTNNVQRQLLERLALRPARRDSANLFIVGDRKQSIYGFRGADVDVFREMTGTLVAAGGEEKSLQLNFRSQPPLINFFNHLFARLFQPKEEAAVAERAQLGYVGHEPSEAKRELRDSGPLVDLLITTESSGDDDDPKLEQTSRDLDAEQLARRIIELTGTVNTGIVNTGTAGVSPASSDKFTQVTARPNNPNYSAFNEGGRDARGPSNSDPSNRDPSVKCSDIALLFRAMTNVQTYESVFRRANIPYQTVLGRGFYDREEITDLIQLLRFLDNKTDELALAAVLRSPLCGISDNALLALRCAPWLDELDTSDPLLHFSQTRNLFHALKRHANIAFISDDEHALLERAAGLINGLIARRHNYGIGNLLRYAVEQSEFMTVIAANFDGAQRLANVQRLFTLAERFERSGAHLIRDFVRYVEEFEAIGSRESEGQIDEATNAVRLMTIHQAKGLEFPVVIIPELQRYSRVPDNWFLLDRHRGLTLKVPDGRGKLVAGCTFKTFEQRQALREQFESMRLLYVAATRAKDRLIFSGTTKDFESLGGKGDTWLKWIWQSLELQAQPRSGVVDLAPEVQIEITPNLIDRPQRAKLATATAPTTVDEDVASLPEEFPLLRKIEPQLNASVHRFSVTQLINYQRCPRQYYFDRVLHLPSPDQMAVWNDAEAPEPPANLTATLKGAVIHRFCETYEKKDDTRELLQESFANVLRSRQAELGDRMLEIDTEAAIAELLPLAENYLTSAVFKRVEQARELAVGDSAAQPSGKVGLWSEMPFRLRRPLGILTGAIDKLLVLPAANGKGFDIEIIDFKTNRMRPQTTGGPASTSSLGPRTSRLQSVAANSPLNVARERRAGRPRSQYAVDQFAFDFEPTPVDAEVVIPPTSLDDQVRSAASDYQLQMQAYALAVSDLLPALVAKGGLIKVTLHFLDPNVEFHLPSELLSRDACARAIDAAMMDIVASHEPAEFPLRPALHCRICSFLSICRGGRQWLRSRVKGRRALAADSRR
ncbi:MAG TPA: UvrD-helicase domain-containing protein [Pyrinomonadaceae bacterium]|nr:UvrD-helicase domain-containing protein [Pyrinomonadaceae bacterium]